MLIGCPHLIGKKDDDRWKGGCVSLLAAIDLSKKDSALFAYFYLLQFLLRFVSLIYYKENSYDDPYP